MCHTDTSSVARQTASFASPSVPSLHSATVQPQLREGAETVSPPDAKRVRPARYAALKTNLAAWAATTVNLAYEVQVGRRFTLDLPLMWSSWDITAEHALRVIAFQPELRYWFSSAGRGISSGCMPMPPATT